MDKLTLKEVEYFGGSKDDLELLTGVDEDEEEELVFNSSAVDKQCEQEIKAFIQKLGLKTGQPKEAHHKTEGVTPKYPTEEPPAQTRGLEKQLISLSPKAHKKMLVSVDSEQLWYDQSDSLEPGDSVSFQVLAHVKHVGEELMQTELSLYEIARQKRKSAGDLRWLKKVLSGGTLSDKMATRTLLIQESPVHTLPSLDSLLTMAGKKGKRECVLALDALKELWLTHLLPNNRKLKSLKQRPLKELVNQEQSLPSRHAKLLLWYYEDQLKAKYAKFLVIIRGLLHDTVANIREKVLGHVFDLLYHKPEQEQELLSQLVNKLGDPVRKIASKASLFLLKLLNHHVNMKVIVATELEKLLHRPNIKSKAQYYCICCLNQFTIAGQDNALAAKLIEIYFTFFKLYIERGELDAKMLGALLTGINRAFPFLRGDTPSFENHMQALFKVVHVGPLATGIQSLLLLYQVMESRQAISTRYYQALYTKLMDSTLKHSGKQGIFLNLLFKSIKNDTEIKRVKAFVKRILQVASFHPPAFLCGCLYLISEVLKIKPFLWPFILEPVTSDIEHFVDVPLSNEVHTENEAQEHISSSSGHSSIGHVSHDSTYQMTHRNPLYCRAESSCLWELSRLTHHFHPSVEVFAKKLVAGEYINYKGDPLQDFTTMHFLDRFVYRNPKQRDSDHGGSLMQRASKLFATTEVPVNSAQFAALKPDKVREDELFMHTYFTQRTTHGREAISDKLKAIEDEEIESEMDFAGELTTVRRQSKRREPNSEAENMEGSDDDADSLMGGASDVGDGVEEMERLLLERLTDSEEESNRDTPQRKRRNDSQLPEGEDMSSLFAAAEEFSHLLEGEEPSSGEALKGKGLTHEKQLLWERRNSHPTKVKGRINTGKKIVRHKQNRKRKRG